MIDDKSTPITTYMVVVTLPIAGGLANTVQESTAGKGYICSRGTAQRFPTTNAIEIWGKVYNGQVLLGNIPNIPTNDAVQGTLNGKNYSFDKISGADQSEGLTYPWNTLAVWAKYDDTANPWEKTAALFMGKKASQTDCGT